mgnify:FL=1
MGGIAPRALQVSYKTQMQGITREDYKFTFDGIEQDPVIVSKLISPIKLKCIADGSALTSLASDSKIAAVEILVALYGFFR